MVLRSLRIACSAFVLLTCASAADAQRAKAAGATADGALDRAIAAARRFLSARIASDGRCKSEYAAFNPRFGGRTALCGYALLEAGARPKDPAVTRAINWLAKAKLHGVYAVAMRANALAALPPNKRVRKLLERDVQWLIRAAADDGSYTYTSMDGKPSRTYDNSNSQMAVLGVWAGASRGVKVPAQYWRRVERFWLAQQQNDGGWGYRRPKAILRTKTYGSMTAAALATLYICEDSLHADRYVRCAGAEEPRAFADGLAWLGKHFDVRRNPGLGVDWHYYWLYSLQRLGRASGLKHFAGHDWYAAGAAELLRRQNEDGSWDYGDRVEQTAFALLFLARGRDPVLLNKLQYKGKWNPRPRDCANFARWFGFEMERPVGWQVVDAAAPQAQWQDAPILYLSGAGTITLTDEQVAKLRRFVLAGGTIVSEAACNSGDFTLDMIRIYKALFPRYPLKRLADDHPIYSVQFATKGLTGLQGVSNGVRLLAVHSARELSLALQRGPGRTDDKERLAYFHLMTNLALVVTDRGKLRRRGVAAWPKAADVKCIATIRVARLKYDGNYDPEPLALERLGILMRNRHRVALEVAPDVSPEKLDAKAAPVAIMTGTKDFKLTDAQAAGLKKFFAAGGALVVDAAGGSEAFAKAVRREIIPLADGGQTGPLAESVVYSGPAKLKKVAYRSDYAFDLGPRAAELGLEGVTIGDRPRGARGLAIVFSPHDITAGLVGYPGYRIRGYTPATAEAIMTNLLCRLAGVKLPAAGGR